MIQNEVVVYLVSNVKGSPHHTLSLGSLKICKICAEPITVDPCEMYAVRNVSECGLTCSDAKKLPLNWRDHVL